MIYGYARVSTKGQAKADRVNGHVLQMKDKEWTIDFSKTLCSIMEIEHELSGKRADDLEEYYDDVLAEIDMTKFVYKLFCRYRTKIEYPPKGVRCIFFRIKSRL